MASRMLVKGAIRVAMLVVSLIAASLLTSTWGAVSDASWTLAIGGLILLPRAATPAIAASTLAAVAVFQPRAQTIWLRERRR
jgi:hypothetical protein